MGEKPKSKFSALSLGSWILVFCIVVVTSFFATAVIKNARSEKNEINYNPKVAESFTQMSNDFSDWKLYENPEYSYSLYYPKFLQPIESVGEGGFLHFVMFAETDFSIGKGVAVGVSENSQELEIQKVKEEIAGSGSGRLVSDDEIEKDGLVGVKLVYDSTEPGAEDRAIVIFNKDGKSYSISTTPEQIDKAVEGFRFTE